MLTRRSVIYGGLRALAGLLVLPGCAAEPSKRPFDSALWRQPYAGDQTRNPRLAMVDDLITRLPRQPYDAVIHALGPSNDLVLDKSYLAYFIGELSSGEAGFLSIYFRNNRVSDTLVQFY